MRAPISPFPTATPAAARRAYHNPSHRQTSNGTINLTLPTVNLCQAPPTRAPNLERTPKTKRNDQP